MKTFAIVSQNFTLIDSKKFKNSTLAFPWFEQHATQPSRWLSRQPGILVELDLSEGEVAKKGADVFQTPRGSWELRYDPIAFKG
jgi:hypothetical protein